ncbi:hypothetical protein LT493_23145 [Streptomyces tricolor]|nr:hypothetical protein [Streptomyces tricolor]
MSTRSSTRTARRSNSATISSGGTRQTEAATERARAAQETAEDRRLNREEAARRRIASVRQLYEAAAGYLDGVREGAKDVAVSESVMLASRARPLPAPRDH